MMECARLEVVVEVDLGRVRLDWAGGSWRRLGREERDRAARREEVRLAPYFRGRVVRIATVYTTVAVELE